MKRSAPLSRRARLSSRTAPARRTPLRKVNRERRASEFARCYHSKERVEWVSAQRCAGCERVGVPCENAHVRTDGMGRKSDYKHILPLCHECHHALHAGGTDSFEWLWAISLEAAAARTAAAWERHVASRPAS